jgi:hypothetical protein
MHQSAITCAVLVQSGLRSTTQRIGRSKYQQSRLPPPRVIQPSIETDDATPGGCGPAVSSLTVPTATRQTTSRSWTATSSKRGLGSGAADNTCPACHTERNFTLTCPCISEHPMSIRTKCQTICLSTNHRCRPRGPATVQAGKMHTATRWKASLCPETVRGKPCSFPRQVRCR